MPKILLIEPDTLLAKTYKTALQTAGYGVQLAADAQDAVHQADEYSPDLVILELQMAAHNGVEFLYEFRSYPEWQSVPVVINSLVPPGEMDENVVLWDYLAVSAYLYKPRTSLPELIYTIGRCLSAAYQV